MSIYLPTNFIKDYIKENSQLSLTDEEMNKVVEIFNVFFSIYSVGIDEDIKPNPESSEEVQERRRFICSGCTEFNQEKGTCNLCGCVIENKIKVGKEHCPMYKWNIDLNLLKSELVRIVDYINQRLSSEEVTTLEEHEEIYRRQTIIDIETAKLKK